jgi:hypothetical protein
VIIEIRSTEERAEAHIVEEDDNPAAPLVVTFQGTVGVWYRLASMVQDGWRVVQASPLEREVLAAHGIMVHKR